MQHHLSRQEKGIMIGKLKSFAKNHYNNIKSTILSHFTHTQWNMAIPICLIKTRQPLKNLAILKNTFVKF